MRSQNLESHICVGYNLMEILPADIVQPIQLSDGAIVLDGEVYANESVLGAGDMIQNTEESAANVPLTLVSSEDGAFSVSAVAGDTIYLARDPLGLKPLYYGESDELYAAASERKALWRIGISSPNCFPPGHVVTVTEKSMVLKKVRTVDKSHSISSSSIIQEVCRRITDSVSSRARDSDEIAVAFSGGLDSGLVAHIAGSLGKKVTAVSVGIRGSRDLRQAEESAGKLKIPIILRSFGREDLEKSVKQVLWNIEETNAMKVEVAIAMRWIAETASENGFKVVLTGQGGDELFAGYARFARILAERGSRLAKDAVVQSVLDAHATNYARDEQVTAPYRLKLRHPLANWELAQLALSIPIDLNIRSGSDRLRKRVLREAARIIELPDSIVESPKRAIQYGSGIHGALSRIANGKKMSVRQLIEKSYSELALDSSLIQ